MKTEFDLDNMKLPKVNTHKQKSTSSQRELEFAILNTIDTVQKEIGYKFHPCEVDNTLLKVLSRRNESYITNIFGNDIID